MIFTTPPDREARLESRELPAATRRVAAAPAKVTAVGVEGALARLQTSLDRVESRQIATLNTLEERYDSKAKRIRGVLTDLGIDGKKAAGGPQAAVGGPFVPLTLRKDAGSFERQLYRIHVARADVDRLTRTLGAVPVRKPIIGEKSTCRPASACGPIHSLAGRPCTPASTSAAARATRCAPPPTARSRPRAGTAATARWSRSITATDFSTRYGHMSEIDVKVGQQIKIGQIIGRVGSTGRSTGPHLHYETRIDGDAVDPQKFLRAGLRLGNAL